MKDTIERSITIDAPHATVWDLVTEPGWWVPDDAPVPADRTPGSVVVRESASWGRYPVEVVELRPMSYAAFRWASGFPGEDLAPGRTTLVEFTVTPTAAGVVVSVVESGFSTLDADPTARARGFESNTEGWAQEFDALRKRAEG